MNFEAEITLSVIVPVGPGDRSWTRLLPTLLPQLVAGTELIISATDLVPDDAPPGARWLVGPPGRAGQQNLAAGLARGRWLWFLHADSSLPADAVQRLRAALEADPTALYYFDLLFEEGPALMRLNQWGVRIRSRLLGLPFGDQGLALARSQFVALGEFPVDAPRGEDHLLVWAARRRGIRILPVGCHLWTSARAYQERGWARTTVTRLGLTIRQALPQAWSWLWRS